MSTLDKRKKESYKIFDEIAKTYDLLNHLLSFGIDIYWRKKLLQRLPSQKNILALDLATGTGDMAIALAQAPSVEKITGLDLSQEMISVGREKIIARNLSHKVALHLGDAVSIPAADGIFDLVTISFGIRNFSDPQASLRDIHRVLNQDGRLLILEFSIPKSRFFKAIYFFYFRYLLPFVGNLLSRHKDAYRYLNQSVEAFAYGEDFANWMQQAGFKKVGFRPLTFGIATLYWGDKVHD